MGSARYGAAAPTATEAATLHFTPAAVARKRIGLRDSPQHARRRAGAGATGRRDHVGLELNERGTIISTSGSCPATTAVMEPGGVDGPSTAAARDRTGGDLAPRPGRLDD